MAAIIHDRLRNANALEDAFYRVTTRLPQISTLNDCETFLKDIARIYGLKNIAYLGVNIPKIAELQPYPVVTYTKEWINRYRERNYFVVDPILPLEFASVMLINWNALTCSNKKFGYVFW